MHQLRILERHHDVELEQLMMGHLGFVYALCECIFDLSCQQVIGGQAAWGGAVKLCRGVQESTIVYPPVLDERPAVFCRANSHQARPKRRLGALFGMLQD